MAIKRNISDNIPRFEADNAKQFTYTSTVTRPATVSFTIYDSNGTGMALSAVSAINSGNVVAESGTTTGLFYINVVVPTTRDFYVSEFIGYDASSLTYRTRTEWEVISSIPTSFFSYSAIADTLRISRTIIGRADLTFWDVKRYVEVAHDKINARLGNLYTIPVSPTFPLIQDMERTFAIYDLLSDVFLKKSIPTPLQKRKDEYDKILQQWETNSLGLPVASGDVMMYRFLGESNTENWKSVFDDRAWVDMRVDPDRVTDDSDKDA
jgi:hypothetical protein